MLYEFSVNVPIDKGTHIGPLTHVKHVPFMEMLSIFFFHLRDSAKLDIKQIRLGVGGIDGKKRKRCAKQGSFVEVENGFEAVD